MSKENIIENWEEIEDACLTDVLPSVEENVYLSREKVAGRFMLNGSVPDSKASCSPNNLKDFRMVLPQSPDEYQSISYSHPTNLQTVKILRRPTQFTEQRSTDTGPRQPIKTLQQREQEYAMARLRILGSATNPADEISASANNSTSTNSSKSSSSKVFQYTNTNSCDGHGNDNVFIGSTYNGQSYAPPINQAHVQKRVPKYNNVTDTMSTNFCSPFRKSELKQQGQPESTKIDFSAMYR